MYLADALGLTATAPVAVRGAAAPIRPTTTGFTTTAVTNAPRAAGNPYPNGMPVSGQGPLGVPFAVDWSPTMSTWVAHGPFGAYPLWTASSFPRIQQQVVQDPRFSTIYADYRDDAGNTFADLLGYFDPDNLYHGNVALAPLAFFTMAPIGKNGYMIIMTGGSGGSGTQSAKYELDPATGYYRPVSVQGSNNLGQMSILDSFGIFVGLATAVLGGAYLIAPAAAAAPAAGEAAAVTAVETGTAVATGGAAAGGAAGGGGGFLSTLLSTVGTVGSVASAAGTVSKLVSGTTGPTAAPTVAPPATPVVPAGTTLIAPDGSIVTTTTAGAIPPGYTVGPTTPAGTQGVPTWTAPMYYPPSALPSATSAAAAAGRPGAGLFASLPSWAIPAAIGAIGLMAVLLMRKPA
jgi:hypothetical protein